ncbi:hypothetical protein WA026_010557 [Henosepilachna vigintioctopunctata]|uniref:C-type lectin domain-containing protein n=1 Tax=Henosepilachna vigintioctopunctata TaxID=420089 RepID=A0AAW1VEK3_9CUCU
MSRSLCSFSAILLFFATFSTGQRITTIQLDGVQYFVSRMNPYSPELNSFLAYQYCRSLGLQLVSFETKEKADSITQYLSNAGFNKYDFWTSGNRLGTNMFLWMSTGLPFNATFNYLKQTEIEDQITSNVPGSTSPQRTARGSDDSGASSACVALKAPTFEWKIDNCMSVKDFICEQTRCYYYNYGSIPVSSAQGKFKTTTASTSSTSSTESIFNNNISNLISKIISSPMQTLTETDRGTADRHPVFLHTSKDIDLEQSTNGPYDNFNSHVEMQDDPSPGTENQEGYVSTIEPEKVTFSFGVNGRDFSGPISSRDMENSAYVPSSAHLNSPALVVFSQAGNLQDALRIQRPFNSQFTMSDATKNLHRPFDATSFGLRHMEAYSSLPAHILNHLQPQFLHPGLSLGSSAFRPLGDFKSFPAPSAFAPPKCLKVETSSSESLIGHGRGIFSPSEDRFMGPSPRADSCSPASTSLSPQPQSQVKEESMDAHMSEDGEAHHSNTTDNDSPGIHEEGRGFRSLPIPCISNKPKYVRIALYFIMLPFGLTTS